MLLLVTGRALTSGPATHARTCIGVPDRPRAMEKANPAAEAPSSAEVSNLQVVARDHSTSSLFISPNDFFFHQTIGSRFENGIQEFRELFPPFPFAYSSREGAHDHADEEGGRRSWRPRSRCRRCTILTSSLSLISIHQQPRFSSSSSSLPFLADTRVCWDDKNQTNQNTKQGHCELTLTLLVPATAFARAQLALNCRQCRKASLPRSLLRNNDCSRVG